jgi:cytochrome c
MSKLPIFCVAAAMTFGLLAVVSANAPAKGDAAKGKAIFESNCAVCHYADSDKKKVGPGLKGLFKQAKLVNGKQVTEANVRALIDAGGNGMPPYKEMLSNQEKSDLIAYLKTL